MDRRRLMLGIVALLAVACDLWPRDNPRDPVRCNPRCPGAEVCLEGRCVGPDASPDLSTDLAFDLEVFPSDLGCKSDADCDDLLACTDTWCSAGGCLSTVKSGHCVVDGACVAEGAQKPDSPFFCVPGRSVTAWTRLPAVNTVAGTSSVSGPPGPTKDPLQTKFSNPIDVAVGAKGTLWVTDNGNHLVRTITHDATIHTYELGTTYYVAFPTGIAFAPDLATSADAVLVASSAHCVVKILPGVSNFTTYAGSCGSNSKCGYLDGSLAASWLLSPWGIARVALKPNQFYLAQTNLATQSCVSCASIPTLCQSSHLRKLSPTDVALVSTPFKLALGLTAEDTGATLYVADAGDHSVYRLETAKLNKIRIAGTGQAGYLDGPGASATLFAPSDVALSSDGKTLFISDSGNYCIRSVDLSSSSFTVSTLAGTCSVKGARDGRADQALFTFPGGMALDGDHTLYVTDSKDHTIRRVMW